LFGIKGVNNLSFSEVVGDLTLGRGY
jgi:hypothetical protein